jgi:hypothetical protein
MSRAYFPLRSSVELFADPTSPEPVARAKHAAILYDDIAFEIGMFEASITEQGSMTNYRPPNMITEEDRRHARRVIAEGEGVAVNVRVEGMDEIQFFSGPLVASYAAEWHAGVIDELLKLKPSWAKQIYMPDETLQAEGLGPLVQEIKGSLEHANPATRADLVHRNFVIDAMSRDAAVAVGLQASVFVTSLFRPILSGLEGISPDRQGLAALEIVVPGVAGLPWEAIGEFREHPGSQEARDKLRSIEGRALADGDEPHDFDTRVAQEITHDLFAAIEELKGSVTKKIAREAANTGVSLIPFAGAFLGPGASLAETIAETVKDRRSWHAALIQLRTAAVGTER